MSSLSSYRVYASTLTSFESLKNVNLPNEIHVVLTFARDFDANGSPTQGVFEACFDIANVTPQVISDIKQNALCPVKFFLSIGGRNPDYAFYINSAEKPAWITNAVNSLKNIINTYGFDGIDVYYQHINSDQFVDAVSQVIVKLKGAGLISTASITVSADLNDTFYYPLYQKADKNIDTVVYQSHTVATCTTSVQAFIRIIEALKYPKTKLSAGHSDTLPSDWSTVPPPVFLGAIPQLLDKKTVSGISKWTVLAADHDPEN